MRDLKNLIADAKQLPEGVPLRITRAENDRLLEQMQPLFGRQISSYREVGGREVQVVD